MIHFGGDVNSEIFDGLNSDEVAERNNKGQTNKAPETTSRSMSEIV